MNKILRIDFNEVTREDFKFFLIKIYVKFCSQIAESSYYFFSIFNKYKLKSFRTILIYENIKVIAIKEIFTQRLEVVGLLKETNKEGQ